MLTINLQTKQVQIFLLSYTLILLFSALFILPVHDTYYYFTWSQKLQLSYLDGPPLIAYLIYITTYIFGNTFFAINIISVICLLGSGYLIYQILKDNQNTQAATIGLLIWLTYPFASTRFIITSMTLDGIEATTSLLIIYFVNKLILSNNKKYIYLIGIAVGLSLIAKYNNILLIIALIIYMLSHKTYRQYLFSYQFIISIIIALVIFSPVLIWNYQHDFASFKYQLHVHDWTGSYDEVNNKANYGIKGIFFYLVSCVLGTLHVLLITLWYLLYKHNKQTLSPIVKICLFSSIFIFTFWLYKSYSAHIGLNYMLSLSGLLIIIIASLATTYISTKKIWFFILLCATISTIMQVDRSIVHDRDSVDYAKYVLNGPLTRPFAK